MGRHSTETLSPVKRLERLEYAVANLTDVIAALAQKIEDIEAAAREQNDQAIADVSAITDRADEILTGIKAQATGLDDPQAGGEIDHAMGENHPDADTSMAYAGGHGH